MQNIICNLSSINDYNYEIRFLFFFSNEERWLINRLRDVGVKIVWGGGPFQQGVCIECWR